MGNWPSARPTSARPQRAPGNTLGHVVRAGPALAPRQAGWAPRRRARGFSANAAAQWLPTKQGRGQGLWLGGGEKGPCAPECPAARRTRTPKRLRSAGGAVRGLGPLTPPRAGTTEREPEGAGQGWPRAAAGWATWRRCFLWGAGDPRPVLGVKGKEYGLGYPIVWHHSVIRGVTAWEGSLRLGPLGL